MKKPVLAALIFLSCSVIAIAADLPARPYSAAPLIPAGYDWSGFYWGANAGYGSERNCWDLVTATGGLIAPEGCHTATGALVGGQFGYRAQGGPFVFGFEAQGDWAHFAGSRTSNAFFFTAPGDVINRTRTDAVALFTGQVGYAFGSVLLYGKGGAAVTANRYQDIATTTGLVGATGTDTRVGGTAGAGLAFGFAPNWSIGVEYDHLFMGNHKVLFTSTGVVPGVAAAGAGVAFDNIRQDVDLVTIRLNYTFGGPSFF